VWCTKPPTGACGRAPRRPAGARGAFPHTTFDGRDGAGERATDDVGCRGEGGRRHRVAASLGLLRRRGGPLPRPASSSGVSWELSQSAHKVENGGQRSAARASAATSSTRLGCSRGRKVDDGTCMRSGDFPEQAVGVPTVNCEF
jgi:hypothetical protein